MTLDDLVDECWAGLPPIRKRIAGKDAVRQIIVDAVQEWSSEYLSACIDDFQRASYAEMLSGRIKARLSGQRECGFVFMSIILAAVISAVVQWLVKWWLDRNINKILMDGWRMELAA